MWFKDNAPLKASPRFRTRHDAPTNQVLLQIADVRPEDVGQYRVVATNPAGEDSTTGSVGLLPEKPTDKDEAAVPPGTLRNKPTPNETGKRPISIVPGSPGQPVPTPAELRKLKPIPTEEQPAEEKPEALRPPKVIVPLKDTTIEEMLPIVLVTTIDAGVPMASVRHCAFLFRFKTGTPFCFSSHGQRMANHYWKATDIRQNTTCLPKCSPYKFSMHVLMIKAPTLFVLQIQWVLMKRPAS